MGAAAVGPEDPATVAAAGAAEVGWPATVGCPAPPEAAAAEGAAAAAVLGSAEAKGLNSLAAGLNLNSGAFALSAEDDAGVLEAAGAAAEGWGPVLEADGCACSKAWPAAVRAGDVKTPPAW